MIDLNPNRRMSCESVLKSEWLKDDEWFSINFYFYFTDLKNMFKIEFSI
jgi:hypothetical protein